MTYVEECKAIDEYLNENHPDFKVRKMADCRWFLDYVNKTANNEELIIEISVIEVGKWYSKIFKDIESAFINLQSYAENDEGCFGAYNIQDIVVPYDDPFDPDRKWRNTTDENWILEATPENLEKILDEVKRRAY